MTGNPSGWEQKLLKFLRQYWPILLIFALALFLRTIKLGSLPGAFYEDEVLSGYLGRYLWQNGMDLYGNHWPLLYFNKFGDYYIVLPMYLDGLSTYVFGVTEFATRLPTALLGALSVFPLAALTTMFFKSKKTGYFSAFLLAILPWHVVLSRATTESVIEMFFLLCGIWALLTAVQKQRWRLYVLAISLFGLSYFIYHTSRVYVPLLMLGTTLIWWSTLKHHWQWRLTLLITSIAFLILTIYIGTTPWGQGRFAQTSILGEQSGVMIRVNEFIFDMGHNSALMARVFHNKVLGFGREFLNQYTQYYSPQFLFFNGWKNTRYAVPESGPVLLTLGLLFLTFLIPSKKVFSFDKKLVLFLVLLWLIAPIPAATTIIESPNVRRSIFIILPLLMTAAFAFKRLSTLQHGKLMTGVFICALALETFYTGFMYYYHHDLVTSAFRSDGWSQSAKYVLAHRNQHQSIYVANRATWPAYYLFYKQDFSPELAHKFQLNLQTDHLDNIIPIDDTCLQANPQVHDQMKLEDLLIEQADCKIDQTRYIKVDRIYGTRQLSGFWALKLKP